MAKVIVQHVCSECGTTTGRWLGKCPGCGAFGSLVEELSGQATPAPEARAASPRTPARSSPTCVSEEAARISTGVPELDRVLGGGIVPASLVLVGGEPGVGQVDVAARGARQRLAGGPAGAARHRRGVGRPGQASRRSARRRRAGRDPGRDGARVRLRDARAGAPRRLRDRLGADALLGRARLGARLGRRRCGRRRAGCCACQGAGRRDDPRRSRDEGRLGRRPAGARAPRRLRASVRGRPLPRAPDPAGGEEPVRIDERARRVRDDGRAGWSASPIPPSSSGGRTAARSGPPSPARSRGRGRSCSRSSRSSPVPISRCRGASRRASIRSGWR